MLVRTEMRSSPRGAPSLFCGTANLTRSASATSGMAHLGYPLYLTTILGGWQLLGAVAVLLPGFPLLKEWAYPGMIFDLSGAAVSHLMVGDRAGRVLAPLALLVLAVASAARQPAAVSPLGPATSD
jgi:hypothetical protein